MGGEGKGQGLCDRNGGSDRPWLRRYESGVRAGDASVGPGSLALALVVRDRKGRNRGGIAVGGTEVISFVSWRVADKRMCGRMCLPWVGYAGG